MEPILTIRRRAEAETLKASAIEYEVFGLPPGHHAIIALARDGWYIQHSNDGIPGERVGAYEAATVALKALQEALAED
jgi:hypothetical protein